MPGSVIEIIVLSLTKDVGWVQVGDYDSRGHQLQHHSWRRPHRDGNIRNFGGDLELVIRRRVPPGATVGRPPLAARVATLQEVLQAARRVAG